ncbi:MAG: SPFH domain-containing protein [Candidatus Eisenbacteria bacterium]|uniref:SPFH domain-containing protein n=1 Tax=Eiseniibacteriota bacterium TaxID=2212470 RepID=A0A948W8I8_UNCEI|nr:SPFH domain-containing protein [Candidatus Eisenbacteria bacterium]MBU1949673.1 SPFH domain-containing protein [Candidatus Eisenbacteria bacterium]MBU2692741.1 SPFH domain-containing protein [Candidatus Eisenbacteria bacterium]
MASEKTHSPQSGYAMLFLAILLLAAGVFCLIQGIRTENGFLIIGVVGCFIVGLLTMTGLFVINPNDSRVLVLFGTYKGTVKKNGFFWANPFLTKKRITLRARNLNSEHIKVNDKAGNPIEIAAVVVWQVEDTFQASFEVDDFEHYVVVQSEAAIRHLAGSYPYDTFGDDDEETLTLRAGKEQVNDVLEQELSERFERAGINVIEARLSHLAYAPEIAEAMLRRQQAVAVVAARTQIVEGAVSMVELALEKLSEKKVVEMDEERKAAMVSNLLVVLCSESSATPVVNTGTLYQ